MVDDGGIGSGSHRQSAERMEELEESVCSAVWHKTEREDQGTVYKLYNTVVRQAAMYAVGE